MQWTNEYKLLCVINTKVKITKSLNDIQLIN